MDYYRVGVVARSHGIKGGIKLQPLTDSTERFSAMKLAYIEADGQHRMVSLHSISVKPDTVILHIEGVETKEQADSLRGAYICVDKQNAVKLEEGRYFIADLIGCEVSDTSGLIYGRLTDVLETGANDVYVIKGSIPMLLPALKKVLIKVDVEDRHILVDAEVLKEVALFED